MYIDPITLSNQTNPAPCLVYYPDEYLSEYFKEGKRAAGFVKIEHDGTKVTSCVWDEEAYQTWAEEYPESTTIPYPTQEERIAALESAMLTMMMGA